MGKKKDFNKYRNQIIPLFTDELLLSREKLLETRFGVYKPLSKSSNKYCICIPLIDENPRLFLFIVGVTFEQLKYGQILGRILISLYTATNGFKESSKTKIENLMLDDLRRWFGYVPSKIYNRRKETFLNKLQTIKYYFQPIVQISNKDPQVYSWEALARDPSSNKDPQKLKAPFDLFTTAELWGPSFLRDLDLYCLRTSIGEFVNFWKRDRQNEKICEPLSINVYSDTLFNKEYKEELNRMVIEEVIINSNYLVLEISERRASPRNPNTDEKEYQNLFLEELSNYARDYNTSFAIDDFGVGFSSVDRLAKLKLKHIKIDKDVLRYEYPLITIKYVLEMVKCFNPSPAKVVIEGYDNNKEINISLRDLYKNKIMYLQGHIVRKAEPSLTSLRESEKTRIKEELSERKKTEDVDE
jgi:EAL domain-containing protein (putative c-di-GMP-specific phosphodiesterase class I)